MACALILKKRLEGYDFFTVTQVHQRALAIESRSKESQETHRHHRSSIHSLECNSDCSNDESKDVYAAKFIWLSQAKSYTYSALKPIHKNQQEKNLLLMYPSVRKYLMSCIRMDTLRFHIPYRCLRS